MGTRAENGADPSRETGFIVLVGTPLHERGQTPFSALVPIFPFFLISARLLLEPAARELAQAPDRSVLGVPPADGVQFRRVSLRTCQRSSCRQWFAAHSSQRIQPSCQSSFARYRQQPWSRRPDTRCP